MMKRVLISILAVFLMGSVAIAKDASEVKLPDSLKAGASDLVLNGSGLRIKTIAFIDLELYVAGLYLKQKSTDSDKVVTADESMGIKLHITSKLISAEKMTNATIEGFEKSTGGNTAPIQKEIDEMMSVFKEEIKVDDVYDFVYVPEKGTEIYKNGKLAKTIVGIEFKKALFGIWMGKDPVQADLKKNLSGA